jgi:hypothetical protein
LWGLTFTGYFFVLWPLSFFNHRLVWRAHAAGGVAAPKVGIAAVNIRGIALKLRVGVRRMGFASSHPHDRSIFGDVRGALVGPD